MSEPSPETLGLLADLIGFDSISSRSNRPMIDHAAAYLASFGIEAQVLPSPDGEKASLWATIGPAIDGGLVLSGHSDVVPGRRSSPGRPIPSPWTSATAAPLAAAPPT